MESTYESLQTEHSTGLHTLVDNQAISELVLDQTILLSPSIYRHVLARCPNHHGSLCYPLSDDSPPQCMSTRTSLAVARLQGPPF